MIDVWNSNVSHQLTTTTQFRTPFLFLFRWLMKINEKIYLLIRVFDDMMIGGEYLLFITATMF